MIEDRGEGCGKKLNLLILLVLVLVALSLTAAGCFCAEGSTWSCQCYNMEGEYVGDASGDGCSCDCTSVMVGARVRNCQVYRPQQPQIYPRPSLGE
jgi:hypothetical protein